MDINAAQAAVPAPHLAGRERICAQCCTSYHSPRATSRYCSDRCKKRHQRGAPKLSGTKPFSVVSLESATSPYPAPCPALETRFRSIAGASEGGPYATIRLHGREVRYMPGKPPKAVPQFIQSAHGERRVYPRTYAEHGLPFPDHLRAKWRA